MVQAYPREQCFATLLLRTESFIPNIINTLSFSELQLGSRSGAFLYPLTSSGMKQATESALPRLTRLALHRTVGFPFKELMRCTRINELRLIECDLVYSSLPGPKSHLPSLRSLTVKDSLTAQVQESSSVRISEFANLSRLHRLVLASAQPPVILLSCLASCAESLGDLRLWGNDHGMSPSPVNSNLILTLLVIALFSFGAVRSSLPEWPSRLLCPRLREIHLTGGFADTTSAIPWMTSVLTELDMPSLERIFLHLLLFGTWAHQATTADRKRHGPVWENLARTLDTPAFEHVQLSVTFTHFELLKSRKEGVHGDHLDEFVGSKLRQWNEDGRVTINHSSP